MFSPHPFCFKGVKTNMTIKECIDIVDNLKPNQYTVKDKVMWLSFIEEIIINEVLKTHEGYDGRYDLFEGYSEDKLSVALIVPSPYDRLYTAYLKMKIDEENGETARYNNSMVMFNTYMTEYRKHYNKTHMPITVISRRSPMPPPGKATSGLSEAEYENLKRDLTYILTEHFADTISDDKVYDVVTRFVQNNVQMLKGKDGINGADGYTPQKGTDYFTKEDIESIKESFMSRVKEIAVPSYAYINILGGEINWDAEDVTNASGEVVGVRYGQTVNVNNAVITERSKVDLQISSEQMVIFYQKGIAFVTENDEGVVTVYCVGKIPENDYTIPVVITEVALNG